MIRDNAGKDVFWERFVRIFSRETEPQGINPPTKKTGEALITFKELCKIWKVSDSVDYAEVGLRILIKTDTYRRAWVAELVDARDLKSLGGRPPCRFKSGPRH
jgi:hypothetical protein